jgi:uncharacterized protein (DUF2235 family)
MSYDISLEIDTGAPDGEWAEVVEIGNCTSNVSPMWRKALGVSLSDFHQVNAAEAAPKLADAVKAMESDPAGYRAMNPPNGWGDYEGALAYLRKLAEACARHPKCRIWVSC